MDFSRFFKVRPAKLLEAFAWGQRWILLPLGNPGEDYALTRHNLGRLLVQRWLRAQGLKPAPVRRFASGTLYALSPQVLCLVPSTYMNLSGEVVAQAMKEGLPLNQLILLYDDKDLPLGSAKFKHTGSPGGHNGVASVLESAGSEAVSRLKLGIGPFTRPLHEYVLREWTEAQWQKVEALDIPFGRFMALLSCSDSLTPLPNQVNAEAFWAMDTAPLPCDGEGEG